MISFIDLEIIGPWPIFSIDFLATTNLILSCLSQLQILAFSLKWTSGGSIDGIDDDELLIRSAGFTLVVEKCELLGDRIILVFGNGDAL